MSNNQPSDLNLDTQCFQEALRLWNVDYMGSDNPSVHLQWWKLSVEQKSQVMLKAQELKREALHIREVFA